MLEKRELTPVERFTLWQGTVSVVFSLAVGWYALFGKEITSQIDRQVTKDQLQQTNAQVEQLSVQMGKLVEVVQEEKVFNAGLTEKMLAEDERFQELERKIEGRQGR